MYTYTYAQTMCIDYLENFPNGTEKTSFDVLSESKFIEHFSKSYTKILKNIEAKMFVQQVELRYINDPSLVYRQFPNCN